MVNYAPGAASPIGNDDYISIQRLIHRYSDAVVHRDAEQWASCWADDAQWDLGRGRLVHGKPAIVELWTKAMGGMEAVVQMVHNGEVWQGATPDTASGRWYIDERFRRASGESAILLAHYSDDYVRTPAGWLFSNRLLCIHYQGAPDLSAEFHNTAEKLAGREVTDA